MLSGNEINRLNPTTEADLEDLLETAEDIFEYHQPTAEQVNAMIEVRKALKEAFITIVKHVPASADRATALRKLREARMDANAAISLNGRY